MLYVVSYGLTVTDPRPFDAYTMFKFDRSDLERIYDISLISLSIYLSISVFVCLSVLVCVPS